MRICLLLMLLSTLCAADAQPTPAGRWKTFDEATGAPKSVVTIWEEGGLFFGRIEQVLKRSPDNPELRCLRCEGDLKGKPLIGLRILSGLKSAGSEWSGGRILDPENGKFYKCFVALLEGGKKLKLRGFIGFSLIGRTQYWTRME